MPETKIQSKQWTTKGVSAPKKGKSAIPAAKVMATAFWDSHEVILVDYFKKGTNIAEAYYASLLVKVYSGRMISEIVHKTGVSLIESSMDFNL